MSITPREGDEDGIAKGIIKMPNALADFMSTGKPQGEGAKELEAPGETDKAHKTCVMGYILGPREAEVRLGQPKDIV